MVSYKCAASTCGHSRTHSSQAEAGLRAPCSSHSPCTPQRLSPPPAGPVPTRNSEQYGLDVNDQAPCHMHHQLCHRFLLHQVPRHTEQDTHPQRPVSENTLSHSAHDSGPPTSSGTLITGDTRSGSCLQGPQPNESPRGRPPSSPQAPSLNCLPGK